MRRHGFGRKHPFNCPKCNRYTAYYDVPAIVSTFLLAVIGQTFLWTGIQLGKYGNVPEAILVCSILTVLLLGFGGYQIWGRKKFLAAQG